ncbi:MAG TPA: HAD-IIIA family hydrolase, partial [Geobacteraceae bacterium]
MHSERLKKIKMLLLDVDGVMTDGRIIFDSNGIESKFFNVKDGHGIKMVQRAGIEVGIISGRESQVVVNRAAELGIVHVYQKALDKLTPYRTILKDAGLADDQVAFMGDDVIDIPVLRRVGFAAAPADAIPEVIPYTHFVTKNR